MSRSARLDLVTRRVAVVLLAATFLLLGATAAAMVTPSARSWVAGHTVRPGGYETGAPSGLPAAWLGHGRPALVVFADPLCPAFGRSQAILTELAGLVRESSEFVLVESRPSGEGPPVPGVKTLESGALDVSTLKVRVAPTLLVLDPQGTVRYVREGEIQAAHRDAALAVLRPLAAEESSGR